MAAINNMHCMLSIDECGIFNIAYAGNRGIQTYKINMAAILVPSCMPGSVLQSKLLITLSVLVDTTPMWSTDVNINSIIWYTPYI